MGLEIYNKPTIKYRIEGFAFFICNSWELMLKAKLIKDGQNIYHTDHPDRTIGLSTSIGRVYTDKNTRIRLNLERIVHLRNTSTHYITEDYEIKYAPLFQACVFNYINELKRFHQRDVADSIAQNFLTLSASYEPLSNEQIRVKYPAEIAEKLIQQANEIEVLSREYNSENFAIDIRQNLYITKNKKDASFTVSLSNDSETKVVLKKELGDKSDKYPYSYNTAIQTIQERMKKHNFKIDYDKGFNSHIFELFSNFYNIKTDDKYTLVHYNEGKEVYKTYSEELIVFILDEIKKNPQGFVKSLKE